MALLRQAPAGQRTAALAPGDVEAVFAPDSGSARVRELFRRAQGLPVRRAVVASVAQQEDYMKRVRGNGGARSTLRTEGIVILGQYTTRCAIARALGLAEPGPGEFVSTRLAPPTAAPQRPPGLSSTGTGGVWPVPRTPLPAPRYCRRYEPTRRNRGGRRVSGYGGGYGFPLRRAGTACAPTACRKATF